MKKPKIHLRMSPTCDRPKCGTPPPPFRRLDLTDELSKVTCIACLKAAGFREGRTDSLIDEEGTVSSTFAEQFIHWDLDWKCVSCQTELRDCAQDVRSFGSWCCDHCLHEHDRSGEPVR